MFEVIPEAKMNWHIDQIIWYNNQPDEKNPQFWQMFKSLKIFLQDTAAEIGSQTLCGSFVEYLSTLIPKYKEHDPSEGPESRGEKLIRFLLEKSAKLEQIRYIKHITLVSLKKGEKIYDLNKSFNIVLRGKLRNNLSGQELTRVTPFADFPL